MTWKRAHSRTGYKMKCVVWPLYIYLNIKYVNKQKKCWKDMQYRGYLSSEDGFSFLKSIFVSLIFSIRGMNYFYIKGESLALAGIAQWIEHRPVNQRVPGSIPSQGTCLGCRATSSLEGWWKATTHWCFSPSFSLSLTQSLKIN